MILRRIGEGIRNQDWFVVLIEIMIVVVGIFIGLQVDDWNESRKDRLREIRYLERIDAELVKDLGSIQRAISRGVERADYGRLLLDSVNDPSVITDDPVRFIIAIEHAGYTLTPTISNHTFEEIKFSGDLAIIQDEALRNALSGYYVLVFQGQQWDYSREYEQNTYKDLQRGILNAEQIIAMNDRTRGNFSYTLADAEEVYDRMLQRPGFIEFIPAAIASRLEKVRRFEGYLEAATGLREDIAGELAERRR